MTMKGALVSLYVIAVMAVVAEGFVAQTNEAARTPVLKAVSDRRSFLAIGAALLPFIAQQSPAWAAGQEKEYRQGIEVNAFNGLIFKDMNEDGNESFLEEMRKKQPSIIISENSS